MKKFFLILYVFGFTLIASSVVLAAGYNNPLQYTRPAYQSGPMEDTLMAPTNVKTVTQSTRHQEPMCCLETIVPLRPVMLAMPMAD